MDKNEIPHPKESLDAEIRDLTILQTLSRRFIEGVDFDLLLQEIVEAAITVTGADKGNLQLLDPLTGTLRIVAQKNFSPAFLRFFEEVKAGEAAACSVALERSERVVVEDITRSSIFENSEALKELLDEGVHAVQSTPLQSRSGRLLGIFSTHFKQVHAPAECELRTLDILARLAADIIERKKSEEETLRLLNAVGKEKDRLSALVSSITDEVWFADTQKKLILANPSALREFGFSSADEIDLEKLVKSLDVCRPNGSPSPIEETPLLRALDGEEVKNQEKIIRVPASGELRYRQVSAAPVRDTSGSIIGAVAIARDITKLKQAEEALFKAMNELESRVQERTAELTKINAMLEAEIVERRKIERSLRKSEEQYRRLIDTAQEGVWVVNTAAKTTYVNKRMAEMLGYTQEELVGRSSFDLLDASDRAGAKRQWRQGKENLKVISDIHYRRKDGSDLWAIVSTSPLFDEKGTFTGVLGTFTDITKRKRDEEKVHEQAALLDKAQDAVAVRDLEHHITYWNKGAERLYGWTAEEAIGRNADEMLYRFLRPVEAKNNVLEKGEWTGELLQVTKDGREITVESRWTLVRDDKGKPKSILIINTDITERKNLETQLLRAQRMESIGRLAGGIAHDLNNLLTPTTISLHLLKERLTDEESRDLLSILEKNAWRAADLTKKMLTFARGIEVERKPIQITHIIQEVENIIKETFPRNIECVKRIQEGLWTTSGDATQIHQVILNLCLNAQDAMPNGGSLTITAENATIDEDYARMNPEAKPGPYIIVAVSDTGRGIPAEIRDKIFEPFFTSKEHGKGSGLGLSTALGILRSHDGFINIYSEIGKGSMFKVYLPAIETTKSVKGGAGEERREKPELRRGQGEVILIAEDEISVLETTKMALESQGYRTITATDGAETVDTYAHNKDEISAILLDMMMPIMDGDAVIKALRKINPNVKIIAVSGFARKDRYEKSIEDTQAFLMKPYTTEKLLRTIHRVLVAQ